ncbi:hypothetical protein WJX72_007958 [[Myrmecia] bisecta]|uniref:C3H1-type domain-containing protein n=1 Tax=[Myrmecia] bisecta TaxID=41462 RepID=A0AAW1R856_9CHLO
MDGAFNQPPKAGDGFDQDEGRRTTGGFRGTAENSKTKLCMRWKNGHCRFGDRCNFAHGDEELRRLPPRNEMGRGRIPQSAYSEGYGAPRGPVGGGYGDYRSGYGGSAYQGAPALGAGGSMGSYSVRGPDPLSAGPRGSSAASNQLWAAQGYPVTGPGGWTEYRTPDTGEAYYHNQRTV